VEPKAGRWDVEELNDGRWDCDAPNDGRCEKFVPSVNDDVVLKLGRDDPDEVVVV
jgi:hypothetical protein